MTRQPDLFETPPTSEADVKQKFYVRLIQRAEQISYGWGSKLLFLPSASYNTPNALERKGRLAILLAYLYSDHLGLTPANGKSANDDLIKRMIDYAFRGLDKISTDRFLMLQEKARRAITIGWQAYMIEESVGGVPKDVTPSEVNIQNLGVSLKACGRNRHFGLAGDGVAREYSRYVVCHAFTAISDIGINNEQITYAINSGVPSCVYPQYRRPDAPLGTTPRPAIFAAEPVPEPPTAVVLRFVARPRLPDDK